MKFKRTLIKLHQLLAGFGIDPLLFIRSMRGLPRFISDLQQFRKVYFGRLKLHPHLHDRYMEGGITKSEYFWQDLFVARLIYEAAPLRHIDVGSRIDGFVAHVASFRQIEVLDVRPVSSQVPGVIFRQANLMDVTTLPMAPEGDGYCDSLSCLHALEHFGLGRYGDPIDSLGYERGFCNMAALLKQGGTFYLSVPIGLERVEFNANWVFDPKTILHLAESNNLVLRHMAVFNYEYGLQENFLIRERIDYEMLLSQNYNLGIFTFSKTGY